MKSETMKAQSEAKFTSGPWVYAFGAIYQGDNADTVEENCGRLLQADRDNPHTMPTERDANCRLAALAPAMLEALEFVLGKGLTDNARATIHGIIARAKGEETL